MSAASKAAYRERRRAAGQPVEAPEAARARAAAYRERKRIAAGKPRRRIGRGPRRKGLRPFMGIDGEGCGRNRKGQQHYMLMCAGNADESYELFTGKPLSTYECLDWICDLPATDEVDLSGFSIGYDITMILRDLPSAKWEDLMADKEAWTGENDKFFRRRRSHYTWFWPPPPPGRPRIMFGLEYIPHNYFRVCRMEEADRASPDGSLVWSSPRSVPGSARTIYEAFGFFQRKFARALGDFQIGTAADRRMIARNKSERAGFVRITKGIRAYCAMECRLHAEMMERFRKNWLDAVGLKPRTWNGPGKLATVLHKSHDTMGTDRLATWVKSGVLQHADAAYYGGRFEMPRIGRLAGRVWEYDLNSAYPAAMRSLPCLEHGEWQYLDGEAIRSLHFKNPTALYVASVAYQHTLKDGCRGMCGLPHRQTGRETVLRRNYTGTLAWPLQGSGTYWSVEIRSAERLGARFRFGPGWAYVARCDCRPFDWVEPLYLERKRLDRENPGQGYPLKLAINSLYGKLAQRVGSPQFANAIWAGLITALTRARLNEAISQHPEAIAMIATDGLYSVAPLALPIGAGLGEWEAKEHKAGLFTVQPGLYWTGDRRPARKTRGVSAGWFTWARRKKFERAWTRYHEAATAAHIPWEQARLIVPPVVELPIRLFIGRALAEDRGDPDLAGCWIETAKNIAFDWHGKRAAHRWMDGPHVATHPLAGGADWVSASYDAEPMMTDLTDLAGAEFEDQPDFLQMLDETD